MGDVVLKIENLYKEYRLGQIGTGTLYQDLQSFWARLRGKEDPNSIISHLSHKNNFKKDRLLALDNISLDVKKGEVLGIIGRNGAGKSTLLKILSRVTAPSKGCVKIKGRIGSLLEVGTGFHPELTGRDNIYLNGAILGMRKHEITKKLDEIIAFSEIERFIDTPVKRYSSGMYVRLAFAVAAHLDSEILLVDEVLAVGDLAFQKKCISKMSDLGTTEGRTVLFVSHQMGVISNLCTRAILLDDGAIIKDSPTQEVVEHYINYSISRTASYTNDSSESEIFVKNLTAIDISKNEPKSHFSIKEPIKLGFKCVRKSGRVEPILAFYVRDLKNRKVFSSETQLKNENFTDNICNTYVTIPAHILVPGEYFFTFSLAVPKVRIIDYAEDAVSVTVVDVGNEFSHYGNKDMGCVFVNCDWKLNN